MNDIERYLDGIRKELEFSAPYYKAYKNKVDQIKASYIPQSQLAIDHFKQAKDDYVAHTEGHALKIKGYIEKLAEVLDNSEFNPEMPGLDFSCRIVASPEASGKAVDDIVRKYADNNTILETLASMCKSEVQAKAIRKHIIKGAELSGMYSDISRLTDPDSALEVFSHSIDVVRRIAAAKFIDMDFSAFGEVRYDFIRSLISGI